MIIDSFINRGSYKIAFQSPHNAHSGLNCSRQSDKQIIVDIQRPDLSGELSPPRPILAPIIEQEELLPNAPCDKDNLRPDPNAASSSPEVSFCQSSPEQFMSISPRHLSPSSLQISPEGSADDSLRELLGAGCCFSESDNQDVKSSMNPINLSFQVKESI